MAKKTYTRGLESLFGLEDADPTALDPAAGADATPADPATEPAEAAAETSEAPAAEDFEEDVGENDGVDVEIPAGEPAPLPADTAVATDTTNLDAPADIGPTDPTVTDEGCSTAESWFFSLEDGIEEIQEEVATAAAEQPETSDAGAVVGDPEVVADVNTETIDAVQDPGTDEGVDVVLPTEEQTVAAQESILPDTNGEDTSFVPDAVNESGEPDETSSITAIEDMPDDVEAVTDTVPVGDPADGQTAILATAERWFVSTESEMADVGEEIYGDGDGDADDGVAPTEVEADIDNGQVDPAVTATEAYNRLEKQLNKIPKGKNTVSSESAVDAFLKF